jgi:hypothetical protein
MGGSAWSREAFESHLKRVVDLPPPADWTYDESLWSHLLETA